MIARFALILSGLALTACVPQEPVGGAPGSASYTCDAGKYFAVNFEQSGDTPSVLVTLQDGQRITLLQEPSETGSVYGWPSDGTNYVLRQNGQTASLNLKDGTKGGAETSVYSNCKLQ